MIILCVTMIIVNRGNNMQYIFIHGLGQTPLSWEGVIDCFSSTMQIDCPNLYSFIEGRKATYENMYLAFRNYCNDLAEPLHLCGISLGAVLALNYAIEFPKKITSLTLIAPQYKTPRLLLKFQTALFQIMPKSAFRGAGIGKRNMILLQKSMLKLNFTPMLNKIVCPTLIVCGRNDRINQRAAKDLAKQLSNTKLEIVENAGHEVNVDMPKKLAEVIANHQSCKC